MIMAPPSTNLDPPSENSSIVLQIYPIPLSPTLSLTSKQIEKLRAASASSRSSIFALSRSHVLYEDQWLIAINKPQGIYSEAVLESLPDLLGDSANSSLPNAGLELHMANRLDRDTSGVMLMTKSRRVASKLVKAFTEHKVRKTYIAVCDGLMPEWENMTIKSGHGRSKCGVWRIYAASDVGRKLPGGSVVKEMETSFQVLPPNGGERSEEACEFRRDANVVLAEEESVRQEGAQVGGEILVRAFPRNGRTHQVRLHCQHLGIPIRGDVKYGGLYQWQGRRYDCHQLHAQCLCFEHPVTCIPLAICAPLPLWAIKY